MRIKCDITGLTAEQSLLCQAIYDIYAEQNLTRSLSVVNLDPLTFTLKTNLTNQQQERLFSEQVEKRIDDYYGEIVDDTLCVKRRNIVRPKRNRRNKSDSDIQTSAPQKVA